MRIKTLGQNCALLQFGNVIILEGVFWKEKQWGDMENYYFGKKGKLIVLRGRSKAKFEYSR